jgi:hypothetical protein
MAVKTARSDFSATLRSMTREEIIKRQEQGSRLRKARKDAGYRSARSAALANNWAESTYRAHEGGTRTIGQDDAEAYAKRLRHKGVAVTAAFILFGEERASTASSEAAAPPAPLPEHPAPATSDIASMDIPRSREQLEIFESQIVREAVEVTARKVYSTVKEKLPTDDVLRVLVGFSLKEYADLKDQRLELAKVADQTRLEGEGRTSGKPTARDPKAR